MIDPAWQSSPFVLLDDARVSGAAPARLYSSPVETIVADDFDEVGPAFDKLRAAQARGLHAAGFLAYEAGFALEPRLGRVERKAGMPLIWFGLFEGFADIAPDAVADLLPDPLGAWAGAPEPEVSFAGYAAMHARVKDAITAGDIYQANLSFRARVPVIGDPLTLYARLRGAALAGWGGIIFTGTHWLLSASPELFFTLDGGALTARPMKGTTVRRNDPQDDRAAAAALAADPKERAENLMIVDLLRNDLSRVAIPGSVQVPELFAVETYPTIHTMTSTVTAELAPHKDAVDVLTALFPCGSVTGAPKIRAMEIIADVEPSPRGPYTGSIGWLDPAGDAAFNVVIRTLAMTKGEHDAAIGQATIGLGGAIVADSTLEAEWAEAHAKGRFVTAGMQRFDLIETMAFDPADGIVRLDRHLARMKASAEALGFTFSRHDARNELQAATFRLRKPARVRLMLARSGRTAIETRPMPANPEIAGVALTPMTARPSDFRLVHKTTDRRCYPAIPDGAFEAVFVDAHGFLTEGSFTSVFVEREGILLTPPLARGLLPGVLRDELIETGAARAAELTPADLEGGFLIGNSLRGLLPARLVSL